MSARIRVIILTSHRRDANSVGAPEGSHVTTAGGVPSMANLLIIDKPVRLTEPSSEIDRLLRLDAGESTSARDVR
jgi:hypothetical protein